MIMNNAVKMQRARKFEEKSKKNPSSDAYYKEKSTLDFMKLSHMPAFARTCLIFKKTCRVILFLKRVREAPVIATSLRFA